MRDNVAFYAYRSLARFAEVLPERAVGPTAALLAKLAMPFMAQEKILVTRNLARVTGQTPTPSEVDATFVNYARYWLDSLRLPVVSTDRLRMAVDVDGLEKFEAAVAQGKGVIMALPHVGNWDVGGAWMVAIGHRLSVVVERLKPEKLFVWFKDFRESLGFKVLINDKHVADALLNELKSGGVVGLVCDRDVDGSGRPIDFFGETTLLPRGPAMLSRRSGAPIVPVAVFQEGSRFRVVIGNVINVDQTDKVRVAVETASKELVKELEVLIRRDPTQWHLFQPNWPSDRHDDATATAAG